MATFVLEIIDDDNLLVTTIEPADVVVAPYQATEIDVTQSSTAVIDVIEQTGSLDVSVGAPSVVEIFAAGMGKGDQGPQGPAGQPRFSGQGPPPTTIIGAIPGDMYLNTLNGDLYTLQ